VREKEWYCEKCDLITRKNGLLPPQCKRCGRLCSEKGGAGE
jgi:hypothetical protein